MIKQTSNTEADKASAETKPRVILEKETARYIFHALLLTLVFAWVCCTRWSAQGGVFAKRRPRSGPALSA